MAQIKSEAMVICDAGPLIHLDELECLDLLTDFQSILVPHQVWQEVTHHRPTALALPELQRIIVTISIEPAFQTLVKSLSLATGEQAALTLMQQYPHAILLTDDAAARLAGQTYGYRVHGTIGVLLRAIRRQQYTKAEVLTILQNLPHQSTLHIRARLLQQIIEQLQK